MKAQEFRKALGQQWPELRLSIPDLHSTPRDNIAQIESIMSAYPEEQIGFVGSSMGGFYATYLAEKYQLKAAVVNPAVAPDVLLQPYLGQQEIYHTGETFTLTQAFIDELTSLRTDQLQHPECFLLLCQEADETLDYREAVTKYEGAQQKIQPGGSHAFDNFEAVIPKIVDFLLG